MVRVVVSLTTMPDKGEKLEKTLLSLHRQTYKPDAIYLGLPGKSRRLGIPYPRPNKKILSLATVVRTKDYGPITKLAGALFSEDDPDTIIISFDDDMIYPDTMIERLVAHHQNYPNSAIGSSGMLLGGSCPLCAITPNEGNFPFNIPKFKVDKDGRLVDSIYGYPGALYLRKFFPPRERLEEEFFNYALLDEDMLMNDDIVISGYLSMKNIERRIFPNMPEVGFVLDEETGVRKRTESEISYNLDKFFQRMNRSVAKAKSVGMYQSTEDMSFGESIIGISAIFVISIILLVFLALLFLMD